MSSLQERSSDSTAILQPVRWGRKGILALLWIIYAGFYFCRVNIAAAQGVMSKDLKIPKKSLGLMIALFKGIYALGQVVNGGLADRFGSRRILVTGLTGTSIINLLFSTLRDSRVMTGVWACNGFFQSCGWTPVVRVIANWFPPAIRDTASGLIGTSYLLGNGMSWLLSGLVTQLLGWRWAFRVPAVICLLLVVVVLLWLREKPKVAITEDKLPEKTPAPEAPHEHVNWIVAIRRPRLWLLALAMTGFMFGHHGLLDWTPNYLAEAASLDAATASRHAFWLPLGGTLGCILLAWFARQTKQQLGPFALAFILAAFAIGIYAFPHILSIYPAGGPPLLLVLGGMSSAPASIMACSMPAMVAGDGSAAFAAGLVDSMGYVGSMFSGILSGWILSRVGQSQGNTAAWNMVWRTWPLGAAIGALLMTILGFTSR